MDEREMKIKSALIRAGRFLEKKGYFVWSVNLYGSQNYLMDTPESDYDFKALIFPSFEEIVDNTKPISKVLEFEGGQIDVKDIRLMFTEYKKQNCQFMETLFTKHYVAFHFVDEWEQLRALAPEIAVADKGRTLNAMTGMAMEKAHALCHLYESKKELISQRGYDAKQLSHTYRLLLMMKKFIDGVSFGDLLVPSEDERYALMQLKLYKPQLKVEDAKFLANSYVNEMTELKKTFAEQHPEMLGVNEETYAKMDAIKHDVMKKVFKAELLKDSLS